MNTFYYVFPANFELTNSTLKMVKPLSVEDILKVPRLDIRKKLYAEYSPCVYYGTQELDEVVVSAMEQDPELEILSIDLF